MERKGPYNGPATGQIENASRCSRNRLRGGQRIVARITRGGRAQSHGSSQAGTEERGGVDKGGAGGEWWEGSGGRGVRGRGRGGLGAAAYAGRGGESGAWRQRRGATQRGGGRGRGGNGGEGAERERSVIRNREHGGAEIGTGGVARRGVRREGPAVARGGGRGAERKDGAGDRKQKNGGTSDSTGRVGAPVGHGLGYKKLEELSVQDPSVVAITLSSHPALQDVLRETMMRTDLVQLLCLVLSKAFKSRTDRATLQHLVSIIKDSGFFRIALPYYLAGMDSDCDSSRRAEYPQQLDNITVILSQVLSTFPANSAQAVKLLLTQLQASVNSLKTSGVEIQPDTEERLENLQCLMRHLQERSREGTLRSDKDTYALLPTGNGNPGEEEQQDFRTIPIYPTPEEFHEEQRPFLRPNLTSQRYTNTHLYLDTHFRLLREDFVRPLRDGVQQLILNQSNTGGNDKPLKNKRFDDIRIYFDTQVLVPKCTRAGMAHIVQFDVQPLQFVRWQNTKRLIYGSLVCLSCDHFESFLLATVSDRDPKNLQKGLVQITFTEESRLKLARIQKGQLFLMVETTAYFEAYRYVLEGLQELEEDNLPFQRYIVECNSDVQPPSYLQRTDTYNLCDIADPKYKERILPFHSLDEKAWPRIEELGLDESQKAALQLALTKELAIIQGPPGTGKTHVGLKIARALLTNQDLWRDKAAMAPMLVVCYTNHALDQFLEGIHAFLRNGIVRIGGRSNSEILKRFNLRELICSHGFKQQLPSHLRHAYSDVFRQLQDEETLIQSESMRLECSLKGVLRENVLRSCISDRHWLGLQYPNGHSKVRINKGFNLIMEWLGLGSTAFLKRETDENEAEEAMELDKEDLIEIAEEADLIQADRIIEDNIDFHGDGDWRYAEDSVREIEEMMLAMNVDNMDIQAEQGKDEWEMQQKQKKKIKKKIGKELRKTTAMTEEEEEVVFDIWSLSLPERWSLYRLWVARYRVQAYTKIEESEQAYQNAVERLADIKRHETIFLLNKAKVIGMTTTGAAKYRKVLQEVKPVVVIIEEAAEVLEAHAITTLSQACQHLILIGDHQQLRPSATVYDLAKNFNLEMSMFERLVKMGLPYVRLNYQHRMRPEIARLLTPHIYSELENHPSVLDYENIKGLKTNLFFVEHNHPEENIKDGKSHQNKHEAMFVVALCRYFLLQDYKPENITILTTYTGQLHCLHNLMPASQFTGVKVHVVDKYQGEENDIVLLSLVRSNPQSKVGFLNIPNRVCVALSRAKKGLYCIGNSAMLSQVKLWSNLFYTLREKDQIGKALTLCCQNHPNREVKVSRGEDFQQAPEGGCTQPCEFRLDCGHVCASVCHPYDPEHKIYKCAKKCQRILCDLGHKCTLVCHRPCPEECPIKVEKIIPRCEHTQMVPCHQDPNTFICQEPCQKRLLCGHPCDLSCGEPCTSKCKVKVTFKLKCGHSQRDACFYKTQIEDLECRNPCEHHFKCGHACQGNCGKCYQGRFHVPCSHQCDRLLICSHKCKEPCTRDCPPCKRPCENRCVHSKCMKRCGQPCVPCKEPCIWQCSHQSCSKLCHEPCDRSPCTQPCAKVLDCGHQCIGLCGDQCPTKCRICNHDEVTDIFFGVEDDPEACFIQLEDCGHIIEHKAMDTWMDDTQQSNEGEHVAIKLKECPKCKTPIRKNGRYGSHINRCLAEIEIVKKMINGNEKYIKQHRETLQNKWKENLLTYGMDLQTEYVHISDQLKETYLTAVDLWVLENKMAFLVKVEKLRKIHREKTLLSESFTLDALEQFVCWLNNSNIRFTEQQVFDLQRELRRLTLLTELNARCDMAEKRGQGVKIQSEVRIIREVLKMSGQFSEQDQVRVEEAMKNLDTKFPSTGLGITEDERKMIVSAMNMRPGHWYKCPNGHVYVITECGGAMESRVCPDCKATIGGASHTLARGNQVASEMDGSQHAAWSETNNLLNFGQLDI